MTEPLPAKRQKKTLATVIAFAILIPLLGIPLVNIVTRAVVPDRHEVTDCIVTGKDVVRTKSNFYPRRGAVFTENCGSFHTAARWGRSAEPEEPFASLIVGESYDFEVRSDGALAWPLIVGARPSRYGSTEVTTLLEDGTYFNGVAALIWDDGFKLIGSEGTDRAQELTRR